MSQADRNVLLEIKGKPASGPPVGTVTEITKFHDNPSTCK